MKTDTNILNELKEISPFLANLPKRNAFAVPGNYFETNLPSPVTEPEHDLAGFSKFSKFAVPENYFDKLPNEILKKAQSQTLVEPPLFYSKAPAFAVPENYFNGLIEDVMRQTQLTGLHESEMAGLNKTTPFAVPENYFDVLAVEVLEKAKQQPATGKIVSLKTFVAKTKYVLAVAATVAGVWLGVNLFNTSPIADTGAELTAQDISTYLNNNSEEYDEQTLIEQVAATNGNTEAGKTKTAEQQLQEDIANTVLNEIDETTLSQNL